MIRQARNYLVGAMSGAGLIAVAVVAFVLLVSAQVFENFPVPGLIGGSDEAAISAAEAAGVAGGTAGAGAPAARGGGGGPAGGGVAGKGSGGGASGNGRQGVGGSGQ